jgi:hypothetical protein
MSDYSYLGVGKVYLRDRSSASLPMLEVGNCSALNLSVTEDVKELKDFTNPGGGTRNEVRRISAVEMAMTMHDLNAANLARALYGSAANQVGGVARTNQAMGTGARGGFVPFGEPHAATPAPVVRAANGRTAVTRADSTAYTVGQYIKAIGSPTHYFKVTTAGTSAASPPGGLGSTTTPGATVVDGTATLTCMGRILLTPVTDYELRSSGILITAAASFTDGEAVEADYTTAEHDAVQALVNSGKEYELFFDGLNEARSGKRVTVRAFRVKVGALAQLPLIGEEFAAAEATGKLLADTSRGVGQSQYFEVDIEA